MQGIGLGLCDLSADEVEQLLHSFEKPSSAQLPAFSTAIVSALKQVLHELEG
ncbi:hypothetical protein [Heliomicrobium undosum]|nr:hypothetical protein [Heliomicrobium undosum]